MTIKKSLQSLLLALIIALPATLSAQVEVTARATAEVIVAINAVEGAILNFGRFSPEDGGGEIRVLPDGTRTSSGSVVLGGGLYNPATFYITGQPEYTVAITLPSTPILLTNSLNGRTMEVHNWTSAPSLDSEVTLSTNGNLNLSLGATLKVGDISDNPVGVYSGTYVVTFSYN
ncbi:MAG: DUF4402 domain-containing protein [Rikenellaceae bacterium]|jgi:hypothetical protein|nr:DUF4402 domain-containing protein [Rikenellaceae bacterium]